MSGEYTTTELGVMIRAYRIRHRLSQDKLARQMGVNRNTIHIWETQNCKPSIGALLQLSELLREPLPEIVRQAETCCVLRRRRRGRLPRKGDQALRTETEDGKM